MAPVYRATQKW